jgi:PAS domain S-box-containing protein
MSEEMFRQVADATPALMWLSDATGACIWFNAPWLAFTGRSLEDEIGKGWEAGIHPEDARKCVDTYAAAFAGREPYRIEYRRRRHDGEWRTLDATGTPRYSQGQFVGFLGSCTDVTDERRAVLALVASEEQLRLATEAAEIGLWDLDTINDVLFWPPRVKAMFGISPDAAVSMSDYYNGLHPDDYASTTAAFAAAIDPKRRALYDVEYRTVGKDDGIIRWVAAKGRAMFDGDRCLRVIGTAIDITPRKASEERLRILNDTLEQRITEVFRERKVYVDIVESTDALVQVIDPDYRILAVNRSLIEHFSQVYGIRPKVGDSLLELLRGKPEEQARAKRHWARALSGEEFTITDEFGDADLERRYYEIKFNTLKDRHGKLIGAFQFVYDVTERLRDQERLKEAEAQLRQSQKLEALGQLTGGVAHDFNNLLMVVSGGLSLLDRSADPARRARLMDRMRQATERGSALSRQLLAFSRKQPLKPQPVDIRGQLAGMRELLDRTLRGDVTVQTQLSIDLWPINVDPAEFELAILNLCVNARDAMPSGGAITISARNAPSMQASGSTPDYVCVTVADTGTGMSQEIMSHMFEPFFTTKAVGKGSGLGLPQVYGFCQQSGGRVEVNSQLHRGTEVNLYLPRTFSVEAPLAVAQLEQPSTSLEEPRKRILVVEDDIEVASCVVQMIETLGHDVVHAVTADAALATLTDDRRIDLVFSDIMMPGPMNGLGLAQTLRSRNSPVPILLTTGYGGPHVGLVEEAGIALLRKPYELRDLHAALREVLAAPM